MRTLRALADTGTTVVFTTHNTDDLAATDRVAFLAPGGCVSYVGKLEDALVRFGARRNADIYDRLSVDTCTPWVEERGRAPDHAGDRASRPGSARCRSGRCSAAATSTCSPATR